MNALTSRHRPRTSPMELWILPTRPCVLHRPLHQSPLSPRHRQSPPRSTPTPSSNHSTHLRNPRSNTPRCYAASASPVAPPSHLPPRSVSPLVPSWALTAVVVVDQRFHNRRNLHPPSRRHSRPPQRPIRVITNSLLPASVVVVVSWCQHQSRLWYDNSLARGRDFKSWLTFRR